MKTIRLPILVLVQCMILLTMAFGATKRVAANLQRAINEAADGDTLIVATGTYEAEPSAYVEDLCGNCLDHRTIVQATKGFFVKGKSLAIVGENAEHTILVTNAGYGFLLLESPNSVLSNLTVTGGKRDTSGNATDAGIVVKFSRVTIHNVRVVDNTKRLDSVIVGIGGIFGRKSSELIIDRCLIRNNTWDGIALYRGASAFLTDNTIDQGRGAGIGITWDATATVLRNRISNYWKGIGTFGTSRAVVRNNAVFDNLGWGLVVTGSSFMEASNNVINHNGNCGVAPWDSAASGIFTNNIITNNGWRKEWVCPQVGYWLNADSLRFEFSYNDVWNNAQGNYRDVGDMTNTHGNISVDPQFTGERDFRIGDSSPLRRIGNPSLTNRDGSRSDIGITGGQSARRSTISR
jgi:hypothetical protein